MNKGILYFGITLLVAGTVGVIGYYIHSQNLRYENNTKLLIQQLEEAEGKLRNLESKDKGAGYTQTPKAPSSKEIAVEAIEQVKQSVYNALTRLSNEELYNKSVEACKICSPGYAVIYIAQPSANNDKMIIDGSINILSQDDLIGDLEYKTRALDLLNGVSYKYSNNNIRFSKGGKYLLFPMKNEECGMKIIEYLDEAKRRVYESL